VRVSDFFGLPHGRPAPIFSALTQYKRGEDSTPIPDAVVGRARLELPIQALRQSISFCQIDYTLEDVHSESGYLHVMFHRENPTSLRKVLSSLRAG